jgi:hypothetical protein
MELSSLSGINLSSPEQIELVRARLAECIVETANNGLTADPDALAQAALRCLSEGNRVTE